MVANTEIKALLHLMDDPDEEVYLSVSDKLLTYGKEIIPHLEDLWENTLDKGTQERIEAIIHKLQLCDLKKELSLWLAHPDDLFNGAFIPDRFFYPGLEPTSTLRELERMRRNIWLELNSYQSPLEQVGIISGILYVYFKIQGNKIDYSSIDEFLFHRVLETGKGNAIANGILFLILCKMLDVPVYAVNIPNQFLLAYFETEFDYRKTFKPNTDKICFFIDPSNGQIYSVENVKVYLAKMDIPPAPSYFRHVPNHRIVKLLLKELAKCLVLGNDEKRLKEMNELIKLIED